MPAETEKQRKFMGAELSRKRKGKKTKTKMPEEMLEHMAGKPLKKAADGTVVPGKKNSSEMIKSGLAKAGY